MQAASARERAREVSDDDIPVPDVSGLITEDDTPVDDVFSEKQMRLLTEPLHASWRAPGERRFFLAANVGVFPTASNEPLVPDVFLALDTAPKRPFHEKRNRSCFIWEHGKPPDVVIEVVSNAEGDELTRKLRGYERMRVAHYVVFDPWHFGSSATSHFEIRGDTLEEVPGAIAFPKLGAVVPRGAERAASEQQRADSEMHRADSEKQRADAEKERAERLAAKLRALWIDVPD